MAPENPYASPQVRELTADVPLSEAERIRQEHLSAEVTCKQVGLLCYFGGSIATIYSAMLFILGAIWWARWDFEFGRLLVVSGMLIGSGVLALLAWVHFRTASRLRRLDPAARFGAILLSVLWLLYFPIGTLLGGHLLWILNSERGKNLFTPEYQAIVAETPHVKYKTSIVVWIFLGLILLSFVVGIVGLTFTE